MEKHEFNERINASAERVWNALWSDASYREWTSVFAEGSYAQTDWQKGSKVLFLDSKGSGMVSVIEDIVPNKYMSFRHMGEVVDGTEDTMSDKVKQWAGAHENYTLMDGGNITELRVEMDLADEYKDYFIKTFPKALEKVKEIAERD